MNRSDPKQSVRELLEEAHPALIGLSHWIHANPEVGFEEHHASDWVNEWLQTAGFQVERGVADMPTALVGRFGPGPLHVAICVEYDALPEVGHACGHNIIAAAGVGAGLALASVADELGLRVSVMGTPAEESGGGKLGFIEAGFFGDVHAAAMIHAWPADVVAPNIIAIAQLDVTYRGHEAHAAGFPHLGRNAADAMVIAQTAIGLLRQQLLPSDRVHGIVTRGGDAPNIIPALTTAQFMVRTQDRARLEELTGLVRRCFEAGALATGTEVEVVEGTRYANMVHDTDLAALYRHNAEQLGRVFDDTPGAPVSTDMGDVSHIVPSIHPMIGIESNGAVNHQREFAEACATPSADQAILDGALGLAWTVIDAAQSQVIRARLLGEAVLREAVAIVEQVEELDSQADLLEDLAGSVVASDPELAAQIAAAAGSLEERADDLADLADSRFEQAQGLTDEALLDEVAGEMESDLEDIVAAIDPSGQLHESDAVAEAEPVFERAIVAETIVEELVSEAEGTAELDATEVGSLGSWEPAAAAASPDEDLNAAEPVESRVDIWGAEESDAAADIVPITAAPEAESDGAVAPEVLATADVAWQDHLGEDLALESEQGSAEAPLPPVAATLDGAHAAWERVFLDVARHAAWEEEFSATATTTLDTLALDERPTSDDGLDAVAEPEALDAEAEPEPEGAAAESPWEQPVAEAETIDAVAEAEPEALDAVAEAEPEGAAAEYPWEQPVAEAETIDAVAEAEPEAEPETIDAVAVAEAEPEAEPETIDAVAEAEPEAEPETIDAVAEAEPEAEPRDSVDDIWYSGAPDDELPSAELVPAEPVGVAAAGDRTQGFVWIPADDEGH